MRNGGATAEPRDVTPGERDAVPAASAFASGDEFAFSRDGAELVYTATPVPVHEEAWSTHYDLLAVNLTTGDRQTLTSNPAADATPRFSPDGRWLAYRAQTRTGFASDRWQLMVLKRATGECHSLTSELDVSVRGFTWAPDNRHLFFHAPAAGQEPIWRVSLDGGDPEQVTTQATASDLNVAPDGQSLIFLQQSFTQPPEVVRLRAGESAPHAITSSNDEALASVDLRAAESVVVPGASGAPVQMWLIKPPQFDAAKQYPVVLWVHDGPQSAFNDAWSAQWNPQVWAAQGYVIALPNPRGSVGFGQAFADAVARDWGGVVVDDLLACLAWLERQPYVDEARMAAAGGGAFGGYLINWFQGHTTKFRALIAQGGIYNFESLYGTTDALWAPEAELGVPWETRDFARFSPHRFAAHFRTPELILHGEQDSRVPPSEARQLFTALQRRGVPSRLVLFPDEGRSIQKPLNSERWHHEVFAWLAEYLK
jgi:dipeptidyl aminopeptidase/acylaminoacyl peptidase